MDEGKYQLNELKPLHIESGNRLQTFINKVVRYAELKAKIQDQSQTSVMIDSASHYAVSEQLMVDTQSNISIPSAVSKDYYKSG